MYSVSVVIPTYNRSGLVRACIESLLAAGLPGVEVVVADDGSTDDTAEVARRYGEDVQYVTQRNAGPAAARNRGFGVSRGRYVTFLDSDDAWRPGVAARLVSQMDAHESLGLLFADTLMGNVNDGYVSFVAEYGGSAFEALPARDLGPGLRQLERWPFFRLLSRKNVMFLGSLLVRRDVFASSGGFDESLRGAADWEFFMRLTASTNVGFSAGEPLAVYEKHSEGMSTDDHHMETDFGLALDAVLRKCHLPDDVRRHVVQRLRDQWFGWAWRAYEAGDYGEARTRLERLRATGHLGVREGAYLALLTLPAPVIRGLRLARRGTSG